MPEMACSAPVYPIGNRVHTMPEMACSAPVYPIGNRVHTMPEMACSAPACVPYREQSAHYARNGM